MEYNFIFIKFVFYTPNKVLSPEGTDYPLYTQYVCIVPGTWYRYSWLRFVCSCPRLKLTVFNGIFSHVVTSSIKGCSSNLGTPSRAWTSSWSVGWMRNPSSWKVCIVIGGMRYLYGHHVHVDTCEGNVISYDGYYEIQDH